MDLFCGLKSVFGWYFFVFQPGIYIGRWDLPKTALDLVNLGPQSSVCNLHHYIWSRHPVLGDNSPQLLLLNIALLLHLQLPGSKFDRRPALSADLSTSLASTTVEQWSVETFLANFARQHFPVWETCLDFTSFCKGCRKFFILWFQHYLKLWSYIDWCWSGFAWTRFHFRLRKYLRP